MLLEKKIPDLPQNFLNMNDWEKNFDKIYKWLSLLSFPKDGMLILYTYDVLESFIKKKSPDQFENTYNEEYFDNFFENFLAGKVFTVAVQFVSETDKSFEVDFHFLLDDRVQVEFIYGLSEESENENLNNMLSDLGIKHTNESEYVTWEEAFLSIKKIYEETMLDFS